VVRVDEANAEIGAETASGNRFDISQEMITNPVANNFVVTFDGQDRPIETQRRERFDPRQVFVFSEHVTQKREEFVPRLHGKKEAYHERDGSVRGVEVDTSKPLGYIDAPDVGE